MRIIVPEEVVEDLKCLSVITVTREGVIPSRNTIFQTLEAELVIDVAQFVIRQNLIGLAHLIQLAQIGREFFSSVAHWMH